MNYAGMEMPLKEPPSAYAKRNCYYGASFPSKADLAGIDEIGEDHVLWGNDYPHYEGTFPYNLKSLRLTFGDMPDSRRRKVLGLNAAALYNFDLEELKARAAKARPDARASGDSSAARGDSSRQRLLSLPRRAPGGLLSRWAMPADIGIVDTMIGFPAEDFKMYDFIRAQLKDPSAKFDFPVEYMFKKVPKELVRISKDPIAVTLHEMDRFGVEIGTHRRRRGSRGQGAEGPS